MSALNKYPPKEPRPMPAYLASSRADVERLVDDLNALPQPLRLVLMVQLWQHKLMLPRGWALRFMFWFAKKRHGQNAMSLLVSIFQKKSPESVQAFWDQTITHIRTGKDREDRDSVGGFSQREINLVTRILAAISNIVDQQRVPQV